MRNEKVRFDAVTSQRVIFDGENAGADRRGASPCSTAGPTRDLAREDQFTPTGTGVTAMLITRVVSVLSVRGYRQKVEGHDDEVTISCEFDAAEDALSVSVRLLPDLSNLRAEASVGLNRLPLGEDQGISGATRRDP